MQIIDSLDNYGNCDFCGGSSRLPLPAEWDYDCEEFSILQTEVIDGVSGTFEFLNLEGWLACQPCADLIEAQDLDGLVARTACAKQRAEWMFRGFFEHRGQRKRLEYTGPVQYEGTFVIDMPEFKR